MHCLDCGRYDNYFINGRCGDCYSRKQTYSHSVPSCKIVGNINYNYKCPECKGEFKNPAMKITYDQNNNTITKYSCPFCNRIMEGL